MPPGDYRLQEALVVFIIVLLLTSSGVLDGWLRPPPAADDPVLVADIAARLVPPSSEPYQLSSPDEDLWGQAGQLRMIQALTGNKTGGFFIETGAHDGESMSNSLLLERRFGWRGLLIEPNRRLFPQLLSKHRRAWALHACVSHNGEPFRAMFRDQLADGLSSVEDGLISQHLSDMVKAKVSPTRELNKYPVDCYPLYSVMLAWNRTTVDFFSLDVEGVEMGVLAYVPWHLVNIKIVLVETFMGLMWNPQTDLIRSFMEERGYLSARLQHDWLFVRRDSEFAADAQRTIRRVRHQIAEDPSVNVQDPFND